MFTIISIMFVGSYEIMPIKNGTDYCATFIINVGKNTGKYCKTNWNIAHTLNTKDGRFQIDTDIVGQKLLVIRIVGTASCRHLNRLYA